MANYITEIEVFNIVQEVVDRFLIPKFEELGMNATGKWKQSLEVKATDKEASIYGQDYTEYLVNGRPPGSYAPIAPLTEWAKAKFGLDEQSAKSMAFAVSNTLKQKGSTHYQAGGTDLLEILESVEVVNFINERIKEVLTISVEIELKRKIKELA